jgi:hypothetical protein
MNIITELTLPPTSEEPNNAVVQLAGPWRRLVARLFDCWWESSVRSLSEQEIVIAHKLGVTSPENVRIVVLEEFPLPRDTELLSEAKRFGFGSNNERGRTNGYVIMLKSEVAQDATVITHELVHVAQIERLGCEAFVKRYLLELQVLGYTRSPLELEAYEKQATV